MEREHALAVWMALLIYPDNPSIKAIDSIVKELVKIGKGLDPIVKLTLKHFKGVNERYSKSMILSYFKLLIGLISYSNEMSELFLKDLVLEICKLGYWILDSHPKVIRMLMERMPTDSVHLAPLNTPSGIVWIAACGFFNVFSFKLGSNFRFYSNRTLEIEIGDFQVCF
jgi:hypothetical protein